MTYMIRMILHPWITCIFLSFPHLEEKEEENCILSEEKVFSCLQFTILSDKKSKRIWNTKKTFSFTDYSTLFYSKNVERTPPVMYETSGERITHSCMTRYRWDVLSKMSSSETMLGCLILRKINREKTFKHDTAYCQTVTRWHSCGIIHIQRVCSIFLFPSIHRDQSYESTLTKPQRPSTAKLWMDNGLHVSAPGTLNKEELYHLS